MEAIANPYETYDGPEEVTVVLCHECGREVNPEECCQIALSWFCDRCIDPKASGFDRLMAQIEQLEATVQGQRAEIRNLRGEITTFKMRPGRKERVW